MVPARRPPNTNARMGTPAGSSQDSAMAGLRVAGEVNREFGWAAFVPDSGVQPSSMRATLVKIVSRRTDAIAAGLVAFEVPGTMGTRRRRRSSPIRVGHPEDQHVPGEPALAPSHRDLHAHDGVRRIGQLHAEARDGRAERPHAQAMSASFVIHTGVLIARACPLTAPGARVARRCEPSPVAGGERRNPRRTRGFGSVAGAGLEPATSRL